MTISLSSEKTAAFLIALMMCGIYLGISVPIGTFVLGGLIWIGAYFFKQYRAATLFPLSNLFLKLKPLARSGLFVLAVLTLLSFGYSSFTGIAPGSSIHKWWTIVAISFCGLVWYLKLRTLKPEFVTHLTTYIVYGCIITSSLYLFESALFQFAGITFHSEKFLLFMRKMGAAYSIMLPFLLLYTLRHDNKRGWIALFLCCLVAFFCGGRSGIIAFAFTAVLSAYFFPWGLVSHWGRSLFRFVNLFILAAIVGTYGNLLMIGERQFVHRLSSPRAATGSGRTDIWRFALENWQDHPVFGIGIFGFRNLDFTGQKLSSTSHPHNIFVEILLETGLVGFTLIGAFVVTLLLKTVWASHRRLMTDPSYVRPAVMAAGLSLVAYAIAGQFMTSFFHGWWLTYPTFIIALLGGLTAIYRNSLTPAPFTPSQEKISIVMPCHNGAGYLAAAIDSVIAQSHSNWELVIINDGSSDGSQAIIDSYTARDPRIVSVVHPEAMGAGAARNSGLDKASARWVAFLDCDDLWKPQKLEIQLAEMIRSGAALSTTYYDVIDSSGTVTGMVEPFDRVFTFGRLLKCNDIGCSVAMIDRDAVGPVRFTDFRRAQDFVFWCSILAKGTLCLCIHQNLGQYRVHSKSRTQNKFETAANRIALLRTALGVPLVVLPYYLGFYVLYGVLKQIRSGEKLGRHIGMISGKTLP